MPKKKSYLKWHEEEDYDIYDDEYIEELLEDDEISAAEEGFMMGYNHASQG